MCIYTSTRRSVKVLSMAPLKRVLASVKLYRSASERSPSEHMHSLKLEGALDLPSLEVHTRELLRFQCIKQIQPLIIQKIVFNKVFGLLRN
ncbi:hypothetical protein U9M48_041998 [Paspalum notatum var. saurae]|uniref:Uncharacterized protein n=1 Tax=Paspalum notatum var. saurae TaxID=547442 RepID=A0AAQ3XET0_PASNO